MLLAEDFATHENAVRKANVLRFLLVVSLLVGVSCYLFKGCIDSSDIQTLRNDSISKSAALEIYKKDNAELSQKQLQLQAELNEAKREKDTEILRLTMERASLQNQVANAELIPLHTLSIISNLDNIIATDPTNRQQLLHLLYSVESLTNAFADAALRPAFELYIDDIKITNTFTANLNKSRQLNLRVKNTSPMAADQLCVTFESSINLDPTNSTATF